MPVWNLAPISAPACCIPRIDFAVNDSRDDGDVTAAPAPRDDHGAGYWPACRMTPAHKRQRQSTTGASDAALRQCRVDIQRTNESASNEPRRLAEVVYGLGVTIGNVMMPMVMSRYYLAPALAVRPAKPA